MTKQNRETLMGVGHELHKRGAIGTPSSFATPDGTLDIATQSILDHDTPTISMLAWATEWARCGFPQVTLGHRLAASLMGSSMAPDLVPQLNIPWPAFSIVVPDGIVFGAGEGGRHEDVACAHVLTDSTQIRILASGDRGTTWSAPTRYLTNLAEPIRDDGPGMLAHPLDSLDERMLTIVDRLFLGVCVELSAPLDRDAIRKASGGRAKRAPGSEPKIWTYALKRDVVVDVREAVKSYVLDGRKSPLYQSYVRGHYRRHPTQGDRLVTVHPHYRGPEGAPIATRQHVLKRR
jgi:hypothetical protein